MMIVGFVYGEDLTVGRDETISLSSDCVYDTITVHGTLNVSNGAKVQVTTVNLGPDANYHWRKRRHGQARGSR